MNGDHILSPHLEGIHEVNISIVLSSSAIAMMVVGIVIYCLIKKKLVRCSEREAQSATAGWRRATTLARLKQHHLSAGF